MRFSIQFKLHFKFANDVITVIKKWADNKSMIVKCILFSTSDIVDCIEVVKSI